MVNDLPAPIADESTGSIPAWLDDGPQHDDEHAPLDLLVPDEVATLPAANPPSAGRARHVALPRSVAFAGTFSELDALDIVDPPALCDIAGIPIAEQETALIRGQANVTKSFVAIHTGIKASGDGLRSLYLSGEGSPGAIRKRMRRVMNGLGLDAAARDRAHIIHGAFHLLDHVDAWVAYLDRVRPALVVIDPLVAYFGGDENSSQEMDAFLRVVDRAKSVGASVVIVHHSTKPDKYGHSSARGSSVLRAWADHEIVVTTSAHPTTVILTHDKSRDGAKAPEREVHWTFTDDAIVMAVSVAAPAPDVRVQHVQPASSTVTTTLLDLLARGDVLPIAKARRMCGNMNSRRFDAAIAPLELAGRIRRVRVPKTDKLGRPRTAWALAIGPRDSAPRDGASCPTDAEAANPPGKMFEGPRDTADACPTDAEHAHAA